VRGGLAPFPHSERRNGGTTPTILPPLDPWRKQTVQEVHYCPHRRVQAGTASDGHEELEGSWTHFHAELPPPHSPSSLSHSLVVCWACGLLEEGGGLLLVCGSLVLWGRLQVRGGRRDRLVPAHVRRSVRRKCFQNKCVEGAVGCGVVLLTLLTLSWKFKGHPLAGKRWSSVRAECEREDVRGGSAWNTGGRTGCYGLARGQSVVACAHQAASCLHLQTQKRVQQQVNPVNCNLSQKHVTFPLQLSTAGHGLGPLFS